MTRNTLVLSVVLALTTSFHFPQVAAQEAPVRPQYPFKTDEQGRVLHLFELNEFLVQVQDVGDEPPARGFHDIENRNDWRGWRKPQVRKMVRDLELEYGIDAVSMTSYIASTFSAYVSPQIAERLRVDWRIAEARAIQDAPVSFSTWSNGWDVGSSEIIPWGKIAIGTDDSTTTTNTIYLLDGGPDATHSNLAISGTAGLFSNTYARLHATHVAGILGATISGRRNSDRS